MEAALWVEKRRAFELAEEILWLSVVAVWLWACYGSFLCPHSLFCKMVNVTQGCGKDLIKSVKPLAWYLVNSRNITVLVFSIFLSLEERQIKKPTPDLTLALLGTDCVNLGKLPSLSWLWFTWVWSQGILNILEFNGRMLKSNTRLPWGLLGQLEEGYSSHPGIHSPGGLAPGLWLRCPRPPVCKFTFRRKTLARSHLLCQCPREPTQTERFKCFWTGNLALAQLTAQAIGAVLLS